MIAVIYAFGPLHGKVEFAKEMPPRQVQINMLAQQPMFQRYEFGEPVGPPRPSMLRERHTYVLHDVFDQDVEQCAIYFHHEDCCEKDYSHSEVYKDARCGYEQPKIWDDSIPSRPTNLNPGKLWQLPTQEEFDRMAFRIQARQNGKSEEYIKAVEANNKLVGQEKRDRTE